jgi:hypothetical protein
MLFISILTKEDKLNNNGWDVIYAIRTDMVTKDLQANFSKLLVDFKYSGKIGEQSYTISGKFSPWSISDVGSATSIGIICPTQNCSLDITQNGKTTTTPLTGITPIIQFGLGFLDGDVNQTKTLRFTASENPSPDDPNGQIVVFNPDSSHVTNDATLLSILRSAWHEIFWQNRKSLDYIFATVNLVPPSDHSWMAPKELTYHFWNAAAGNSYLCILTMTSNHSIQGLNPVPDSDLFTNGNGEDVFVSISPEMLMVNMILPALGSGYTCNGTSITGSKNMSVSNARYVHVTSISMSVSGASLPMTYSGTAGIMTDSTMTFQGSQSENFSYSNGKIKFNGAKGSFNHQEHLDFWDGLLTGLSAGIYYGIESAIESGIADSIQSGMGSTFDLSLGAVQWGTKTAVNINNARMNNALILQAI